MRNRKLEHPTHPAGVLLVRMQVLASAELSLARLLWL